MSTLMAELPVTKLQLIVIIKLGGESFFFYVGLTLEVIFTLGKEEKNC